MKKSTNLGLLSGFTLAFFSLAAPLWAVDMEITTERERTYDGEIVQARVQVEILSTDVAAKLAKAQVEVSWSILTKELKKEIRPVTSILLGKGGNEFSFQAPKALRAPVSLQVSAVLQNVDQDLKIMATNKIQIFPSSISYYWTPPLAKTKIAIYDPVGSVRAELDRLGIMADVLAQPFPSLEEIPYDLVILGSGAMDQNAKKFLTSLQRHVENGLAVLCLEQTSLPVDFPIKAFLEPHDVLADSVTYYSFLQLPTEILPPKGWGSGTMAANTLIWVPQDPAFKILLGVQPLSTKDKETPLPIQAALAVHCPWGQGQYILSQLQISSHFRDEPLARWILACLLKAGLDDHNE
jgi:hypothetical protein